ncbi:MAG: hypothetical protein ACI9JN_001275 [Bacteroidia bacterium]|jgi:hypothetical protein
MTLSQRHSREKRRTKQPKSPAVDDFCKNQINHIFDNNKSEFEKLLKAYRSMQQLSNDLDELHDSVHFKCGLKRNISVTQMSLNRVLIPLYKSMSKEEIDSFNLTVLDGKLILND